MKSVTMTLLYVTYERIALVSLPYEWFFYDEYWLNISFNSRTVITNDKDKE
jgi:hypothetical protein